MSIADADPIVLHRIIAVGWVPQVIDDNASLRLQVALLTGQRDDLARELAALTDAATALWERVAALEAGEARHFARALRHPAPSRPAVAWATVCCAWFAAWQWFETDASAMGEWS